MGAVTLKETQIESVDSLLELAETYRVEACSHIEGAERSQLGQFLTPTPVAVRLASMLRDFGDEVVLLEPGAGVGSLIVAAMGKLLAQKRKPRSVHIVAYELEGRFIAYLEDVLKALCGLLSKNGIKTSYEIRNVDFVASAVEMLSGDLFGTEAIQATHAILNPPFRKIGTDSVERVALQRVGIECSNLYAAFVWLTQRLLVRGGQMAAITPRSFCNGPYFRAFREGLLSEVAFDHFLLIEERNLAFSDDGVLQETVLYHGSKALPQPTNVLVETAYGGRLEDSTTREVPFVQVVDPDDREQMFHLAADEHQAEIKREMEGLQAKLEDLGLKISTGRVVDFRAKEHLRMEPETGAVPLIYPLHLRSRVVTWPVMPARKANGLMACEQTQSLLVPMGHYVLLKRFTSKEEDRRVVATVFSPTASMKGLQTVGFENHLNYFHTDGQPLSPELARGLAAFLNSSALDSYFRQFSGHTQVNATDLRGIRYPSMEQLIALGRRLGVAEDQLTIDTAIADILEFMPASQNALEASRRIEEAELILKSIGVPREQQNERSALVLLALAGIRPETAWAKVTAPMLGITEMMDFFRDAYGKNYAPNTRETVRRQTVHQFVQIGLLIQNPDKPDRPVNSPHNVYQLETTALTLLKLFGTKTWSGAVDDYKIAATKLAALREKEREMARMPVTMPDGEVIQLTAGGQNDLMKALVEEFCPRFTPGGHVLYLGDAGAKWLVQEPKALAKLGIVVDEHGKMPDLVVHFTDKNWLVLIEAVTSHGPMNLKRKNELRELFGKSKAGLVFVTAFPTRSAMLKYLGEISWETEVWVAEAPSHMIHFNGERFLGPYES